MKILKVITIGGLAVALVAGALAQGAGPAGGLKQDKQGKAGQGGKKGGPGQMRMMRGKRMQEFFAKLDLTADQKKKIEALQKSTGDKMKALREKGGAQPGDRKAMMEKFRPIMEAHQKAMKEILTAEQEKKLDALIKEAREKGRKERGAPGQRKGGTPPPKGGGGGGGL